MSHHSGFCCRKRWWHWWWCRLEFFTCAKLQSNHHKDTGTRFVYRLDALPTAQLLQQFWCNGLWLSAVEHVITTSMPIILYTVLGWLISDNRAEPIYAPFSFTSLCAYSCYSFALFFYGPPSRSSGVLASEGWRESWQPSCKVQPGASYGQIQNGWPVCCLRGWKNRPAPFPGQMSYGKRRLEPGLVTLISPLLTYVFECLDVY